MSDPDPDLDPDEAKGPPLDITGRDPATIGRRLWLTRQVFGLKQIEFSKRANVDNTAHNQFENGVQKPSMEFRSGAVRRLLSDAWLDLPGRLAWPAPRDRRGDFGALNGRSLGVDRLCDCLSYNAAWERDA